MGMGKRSESRQQEFWVATETLAGESRHVFYDRLNGLLVEAGFDRFIESICEEFYNDGGLDVRTYLPERQGGDRVWADKDPATKAAFHGNRQGRKHSQPGFGQKARTQWRAVQSSANAHSNFPLNSLGRATFASRQLLVWAYLH